MGSVYVKVNHMLGKFRKFPIVQNFRLYITYIKFVMYYYILKTESYLIYL
ncbi:hypothetical protein HanRHA438_Chr01g0025671 [Helianthus annuus]|nr:hypothetical protein HanRHA438_Chr01g0025671 [Helianthus annuus]